MASRAIRSITTRFTADISDWERQMQKASKRLEKTANEMRAVGTKLSMYVTAPFLAIAAAASKLGMDAVESENLFDVSMGNMANSARLWSQKLAASLRLNEYEIRKNLGVFDVMFTSMDIGKQSALDMSEGLTKLAYDMSSLYNIPYTDVFEKLQSGIMGQPRPLKELGIDVSDLSVKNYALTLGLIKQGQEMTQAQEVIARYMLIMKRTSVSQGDLARTIDSPANKLKQLKDRAAELGIEIGQKLIPFEVKLMDILTDLMNAWNSLNPATQEAVLVVGALTAATGPLIMGMSQVSAALSFMMANPVVAAIAGIAALTSAIYIATGGFGQFEKEQRATQDRMIDTTSEMIRQKKAANDLGSAILGVSYVEAKQAKDRYYNDLMKEALTYEMLEDKILDLEKRKKSMLYKPGTSLQPEIDIAQKQLEESMQKMKDSRKRMDESQQIMDQWSKIQTPALKTPTDTTKELKDEFAKLGTTASDTYKKLNDGVKDFVKNIQDQTKEFTNFTSLFDKVSLDQPVSMNRWLNRLKKQLDAMQKYQQSIGILQSKANSGVISQGLFAELQAMGPQAAKQLQVLSKASNAQLSQANSLFGQKYAIGQNAAIDMAKSNIAQEAKFNQIIFSITGNKLSLDEEDIRPFMNKIVKELKAAGVTVNAK